jgi:hypothetical protein
MGSENILQNKLQAILKRNAVSEEHLNKFVFVPYSLYETFKRDDRFHIFEDWWVRKPDIVLSKVISYLGLSDRIYGRECSVKNIDKPRADAFLKQNHILGSTNSKVKLGIFFRGELVSLATFAAQRHFRNGNRSVELLRFCHKNNLTVVGGIDKLLKSYTRSYQPDEIMTYIDLDWGSGDSFIKLGFEKKKLRVLYFFV